MVKHKAGRGSKFKELKGKPKVVSGNIFNQILGQAKADHGNKFRDILGQAKADHGNKFNQILGQAQDDGATTFIQEWEEVFATQKPPPTPNVPALTRHPRLDLGSANVTFISVDLILGSDY